MGEGRSIRSMPWTQRHDVLTAEEVATLHGQSLEILRRVGVTTSNRGLLDSMREAGQDVDLEAGRIRFDPAYVQQCIDLSPAHYTLAARDPDLDLPLDDTAGYLSTDGCPAEIIDLETGKRRPSTKQDVADITRLADALPQIGYLWQSVSANDTPVPVRPMHETHAQFPVTTKHIQQMTAIDPFNARGIVEMAQVVTGGADALRERPILSNFQCSISPLHWDEGPVDAMRVFAEAGVPVGICSMPLAGASAPLTVAGMVAMANAEILSGVAILQTLVPGSKTMHISYVATIDLSSGTMYDAWGAPELYSAIATTQLARTYGIPFSVWAFSSGSKSSDWQAGVQSALSGMSMAMSPGHLITGAGSLHEANVYSLSELVLHAELWELLVRFAEGFSFAAEDVAVDTIAEVGPGGHFLAQEHTRRNMPVFWRDTVMDRRSWDEWEAEGRPTPSKAAEAKARELLATHEPEPLPEDVAAELDRILAAYEAQALSEAD